MAGLCHVKQLPSRRWFCVHHSTMHQFKVSLHSKPHILRVHVCLAVTWHLNFWQNDWNLLRTAAVTRGCNGHRNACWTRRKLNTEKKILPPPLRGHGPSTFQSRDQTTELPPQPVLCARRTLTPCDDYTDTEATFVQPGHSRNFIWDVIIVPHCDCVSRCAFGYGQCSQKKRWVLRADLNDAVEEECRRE